METTPNSVWTFLSHVEFPAEMAPFLVAGEVPVASFKTVRDTATFTNRRLIVRDAQGLRGKKIETVSIPYSSISMWSTENARGPRRVASSPCAPCRCAGHTALPGSRAGGC